MPRLDLAAHLQDQEEQLFEHSVRSSRERLEDLLSRDFREIGSSGRLYTFDAIVEALLAEDAGGLSRGEGFEMRKLAETVALLTYRGTHLAADGSERRTLRSSIWQLEEDGRWRMVFHQGTLVP
ncbi:DUF4440 domain-containing protein [Rhizobium sp. BK251]|uniref:nuclear transport factor 2 family protein n=1 Tax=Rhizobium sp. BK251 TaxID=2512125 RepID=UPI0010F3B738|nr:DUF4440 domain-containing protein [Rhizobium sp. BK251]TCL69712.1 hypothetical protein EV286_108287 [Rhizobium sp. BK251]